MNKLFASVKYSNSHICLEGLSVENKGLSLLICSNSISGRNEECLQEDKVCAFIRTQELNWLQTNSFYAQVHSAVILLSSLVDVTFLWVT